MRVNEDGHIGIGTTSPVATLDIQGNLAESLTGTVDVTSGTDAVTGTGTAFDTELSVGDAIEIDGEVFTVSAIASATSLTLDSNHATGATAASATKDSTVLSLNNGDSQNLFTVLPNGNVGIGTSNPTSVLHIESSAGLTQNLISGASNATAINMGDSADIDSGKIQYSNLIDAMTFTTNANERMRISAAGNVGIGTISPSTALEVDGTITATAFVGDGSGLTGISATDVNAGAGTVGAPSVGFSTDTDTGFYSSGANQVGVSAGGAEVFSFSSTGLTSPTTGGALVTSGNGTAGAPTFSFAGDTDTGWFRPADNELAASTDGTERIRIDDSGNVGIGTTNPTGALEVIGASPTKIEREEAGPGVAQVLVLRRTNSSGAGADGIGATLAFQVETETEGTNETLAKIRAITEDATAGTIDGQLQFNTFIDGTENTRMTIVSDGNVGIGTTSPESKLVIQDGSAARSISFKGWEASSGIDNTVPGSTQGPVIEGGENTHLVFSLKDNDATDGFHFVSTGQTYGGGGADDEIDTHLMTINGGGNVGIGTSDPDLKLHVADSLDGNIARIVVENSFTNTASSVDEGAGIYFGFGGDNFGAAVVGVKEGDYTSVAEEDSGLEFYTNLNGNLGDPKMYISSDGNVGIGTSSPNATSYGGTTLTVVSSELSGGNLEVGTTAADGDNVFTGSLSFIADANTTAADKRTAYIRSSTDGATANNRGGSLSFYTKEDNAAIAERMIIDSIGNIGVGTTTPAKRLTVVDPDSAQLNLSRAGTGAGMFLGSPEGNEGIIGIGVEFDIVFPAVSTWTARSTEAAVLRAENGSFIFYGDTGLTSGVAYTPTESMRITSTGNVGVGTGATVDEKFHVVGNIKVEGSTTCTLGNGSSGTNCSSDERLKDEITPIQNALEKIQKIKGVEFVWNDLARAPGRKDIGVIAQDIQKVFPTAVIEDKNGYLSVDYAVLVSPLIESVKELDFNHKMFKLMKNGVDFEQTRRIASLENTNEKIMIENQKIRAENQEIKEENREIKEALCSIAPNLKICK